MQVAKDMFKQSLYGRVSSWLTDRPEHLEISVWTNEHVTRLNTLQTTQFEHLVKHAGPNGIKVERLLHKLELWSPNFRLLEIVDRRRSSAEHHWVFKKGSRVILTFKSRTTTNSLLENEDEDEPLSAWFNNDKSKDVLFTVRQFLGRHCHGFEHQTRDALPVHEIWFASGMPCVWPADLHVEFLDGTIRKISHNSKQVKL